LQQLTSSVNNKHFCSQQKAAEKISIGPYFDLQKAFDSVNHKMLLYKLQKLGVRVVARDWFKNHLTDCNDVNLK